MIIIVYGSIVDGWQFIGPFDDEDVADKWASDVFYGDDNWIVVRLDKPEYWEKENVVS